MSRDNRDLMDAVSKILHLEEDTSNWKVFIHQDFNANWIDKHVKSAESKKLLYSKVTSIDHDLQIVKLHGVFGESYRDVCIREIDITYRSDHNFSVKISKQMKDFALDYFTAVQRVSDYVSRSR